MFCFFVYVLLFSEWVNLKLPQGTWVSWVYNPQIFFLIASLFLYRLSRDTDKTLPRRNLYYWCLVAFSLGSLIYIVMFALHLVLSGTQGLQPLSRISVSTQAWIFLLILAPVSEELFFRGIVFRVLQRQNGLWLGMIFSTLLFMATHSGLFLGTFSLGLITCWMTHQSGSILPAMIFHALSNGLVTFAHNMAPNLGAIKAFIFF